MASQRAIWARVSTDEQESGNQVPELRQWAARCGREIAAEYVVDGAGQSRRFS
jgi:DNA invertase Pin-like site-specific DNA recombinase